MSRNAATHRLSHRLGMGELEIMLAVARHGTMAKAATALGVSQPAISRAIAELEKTLGVRLLERNRRGVSLTRHGEALGRRAALVLDEVARGISELQYLSDPNVGEINVGSPEPLTEALLPEVIGHFSAKYPRVRINIVPTRGGDFTHLRERKIDFMLGRTPLDFAAPDIEAQQLFEEQLFVVAGQRSPWTRHKTLQLSDLGAERWVVTNAAFEPMPFAFSMFGLPVPTPSVAAHTTFLRNVLVASGQFLAVFAAPQLLTLRRQNSKVSILPIDLSKFKNKIAIFALRKRPLEPVAALFVEQIREVCRSGRFAAEMRQLNR